MTGQPRPSSLIKSLKRCVARWDCVDVRRPLMIESMVGLWALLTAKQWCDSVGRTFLAVVANALGGLDLESAPISPATAED